MRKKLLILTCAAMLILSGCVNVVEMDEYVSRETTENTWIPPKTEEHIEKNTKYYDEVADIDNTSGEVVYSFEKIELPQKAVMTSYYIYDNLIFYSYYEYNDSAEPGAVYGTGDGKGTNLCRYDMDTGKSELIYEAKDKSISNIEYNGRYLVWKEKNDVGANIKVIDTEKDKYESVNIDAIDNLVSFVVAKDYIFWMNNRLEVKEYSVYRYSLETGEMVELIANLNSVLPVMNIEKSQNIICVCSYNTPYTNIRGYNFDGVLMYNYDTEGLVFDATCNSYGIAWMRDMELLFYDAKSKKINKLGEISDYVLVEDCIVVSAGFNGVYSYKTSENTLKYVIETSQQSMVGLSVDPNGKVYGKWITPMQSIQNVHNEFLILQVTNNVELN